MAPPPAPESYPQRETEHIPYKGNYKLVGTAVEVGVPVYIPYKGNYKVHRLAVRASDYRAYPTKGITRPQALYNASVDLNRIPYKGNYKLRPLQPLCVYEIKAYPTKGITS